MNRRKIAALLLPVLLCLAGCGAAAAEPEALPTSGSPGGEEFSVDILSTGKSDCILIRMDGQTILCDTADGDDLDAILALLRDRGVERIDALVLSHYDKDHIGSAPGLLAAVTVGEIYGPDYVEDSDEYKALAAGVKATGTPWHRLLGEDRLDTNGLRNDDKGRHTTTHRELILLPCGATVIDTPGMRELGMWDAGAGLSAAFGDVEELARGCRFSNCTHRTEPGCAVRAALESGELAADRWQAWLKLQTENRYCEDAKGYQQAKNARNMKIAMMNRAARKKN